MARPGWGRRVLRLWQRIVPLRLFFLYSRWPSHSLSHRGAYFPRAVAERCFGDTLVLKVDPERIALRVRQDGEKARRQAARRIYREYFVWDGDWDRKPQPFTEHPLYVDLREVFEGGLHYRKTRAYAKRVEAMERGIPYHGVELGEERRGELLDSLAKIDRYFETRIELFSDMKRHGYRSQQELGTGHSEIGVAIDRDGNLLKRANGRNRLVVAKLVKTPWILVQVQLVHHQWVERCVQTCGGSRLAAIRQGLRDLQAP